MALESTQLLTEMSIRNLPRSKGWQPKRKADNLTPSVSQLSSQRGSLDILQPDGPPQPITWIALPFYLIPPPSQSLPGNGLVKTFPWQQIHITMEEMLDALFSLWSVSYKSRVCVSVYPLSLLGDGLINMFLWQQRTVEGIIFYVVRVISKKVGKYFFPKLLVF
jgi:hypothetical protein